MQKMSRAECLEYLRRADPPHTGKLATVRADGRPHVAPIWYDVDGDELVFMTWHESVKAANMRRDPRVCLCMDDETPPFSFVQVEGVATIEAQAADLRYWAARIGGRYMGAENAEAYGVRNGVPGELLVRVKLAKLVGFWEMAA